MTRESLYKLRTEIRNYQWGSRTALAQLRGDSTPSMEPEAELWVGGHPSAASRLCRDGEWQRLDRVLEVDAVAVMGEEAVARFGRALPFLLKILAIESPLSLQAHPDAERARVGFDREEQAGIPHHGKNRNYRDRNPKPEIVVALTDFRALRGLRRAVETERLLAVSGIAELLPDDTQNELARGDELKAMASMLRATTPAALARIADRLERGGRAPSEGLTHELLEIYPRDPAALAPFFLEIIELEAGEAMFTPPGVLHAYLGGVAIELMANSDNVLRAGLTSKCVDLDALLAILSPDRSAWQVATIRRGLEIEFSTSAEQFRLSRLDLRCERTRPFREPEVELLLCTSGECEITDLSNSSGLVIGPCESALVPAATGEYELSGSATVFRARQGLRSKVE